MYIFCYNIPCLFVFSIFIVLKSVSDSDLLLIVFLLCFCELGQSPSFCVGILISFHGIMMIVVLIMCFVRWNFRVGR